MNLHASSTIKVMQLLHTKNQHLQTACIFVSRFGFRSLISIKQLAVKILCDGTDNNAARNNTMNTNQKYYSITHRKYC
jgi:hypothetical protein